MNNYGHSLEGDGVESSRIERRICQTCAGQHGADTMDVTCHHNGECKCTRSQSGVLFAVKCVADFHYSPAEEDYSTVPSVHIDQQNRHSEFIKVPFT